LYCAVRGFQAERRAWRWYVPAILASAFGMAVKEVMAVTPLLVLLYDIVFVSKSLKAALRRRWRLYTGLAATWSLLAVLFALTPQDAYGDFVVRSPLRHALTQPGVILYYLRLCVWPSPLLADYNWPYADSAAAVVPAGIVIAALLAGDPKPKKKDPHYIKGETDQQWVHRYLEQRFRRTLVAILNKAEKNGLTKAKLDPGIPEGLKG
ncbi:hypothetical protein LCGC14_3049940, partial [marine sediment metagenome]